MPRVSVVSGGFDPIHSGHISLINEAAKLGDSVVILLNSDQWLIEKKGKFFLNYAERKNILENLKNVDKVIDFDDNDGSASLGLQKIKKLFPTDTIVFCNGGDRNSDDDIPENKISDIIFKYGVGGDTKMNSSSELLNEYTKKSTQRDWGEWSVTKNYPQYGVKVKELIVKPGSSTSLQKHQHRNELMLVCKGTLSNYDGTKTQLISKHDHLVIHKDSWHQIQNNGKEFLHIVEIQYGDRCDESDIERTTNDK